MTTPNPIPTVTAPELAALLGTSRAPFLLDVRTTEEHEARSIPGSVNIPLDRLDQHLDQLPREPFVVYCAGGNRSRLAVEALQAARFPARDLEGGIAAWPLP